MMAVSVRSVLLQLILLVGSIVIFVRSGAIESKTCSATDGTCTNDDAVVPGDGDPAAAADGELPCVDEHEKCKFWASLVPSECDENPNYMMHHCRKSCNACEEL